MKIAKCSYSHFRKRLVEDLNAWFKNNTDNEEKDDYKLSDDSFDAEIYRTLEYATTGYGFVNSLKRVPGNDIDADFENVLFDTTGDLYEDSIRGFYRVYDGKSVILGFLFGGDGDYPMNGLIFLNDEEEFCLYIPVKGNVVNVEGGCAYTYSIDEDDLDDADQQEMIEDFKANVKL